MPKQKIGKNDITIVNNLTLLNKNVNNSKRSNKTKKVKHLSRSRYTMSNATTGREYEYLKQMPNGNWVYQMYVTEDDDTMNKKNKNKNRCMCINYKSQNDFKSYDRCPRTVVNGSDFCELHQNCKSYLRNFLSGSEPSYMPELWSNPYVEGSHNCYSYFLNRQVKAVKEKCEEICLKKHKKGCPQKDNECTDLKPQPGDFELIKRTGTDKGKERKYFCPNMQKKILADNPTLIPTTFNAKCPANHYKGAMVVDSSGKNGNTYHFYRLNKNGLWDHKPGISPISDVDASGKPIYVPHFADRDYSNEDDDDSIKYNGFCGYYCIPINSHRNLA